jgi:predicted MPP superfamily phosphohydrolase
LIEPRIIFTKHFVLKEHVQLEQKIKIIQFSDTHLKSKNDVETLKKVALKINNMQPDFVVFTGDLISDIRKFSYKNEVINILTSIKAKRGKLAIYGNHDHGGYFTEEYVDVLTKSNFILLQNKEKTFYIDKQKISFIGLDDYMLGDKNYKSILQTIQKNAFTIVLAHEPDTATITENYPIQLQLSGHSHGGQIYFPFFHHIFMPPFAKKYNRGKYILSNKTNTTLFVSNGIGTTKLPIRFFTPPEIIEIEIKKTS